MACATVRIDKPVFHFQEKNCCRYQVFTDITVAVETGRMSGAMETARF
jgi:hypothetical protein